jgi:hypothetical protein
MQQTEKAHGTDFKTVTAVPELEFERTELAGQVVPVRPTTPSPVTEYVILPPSANETPLVNHGQTALALIVWVAAASAVALVGVIVWNLATVTIPAFFTGAAAGAAAGGAVVGEWVVIAIGVIVGLAVLAIGFGFLSSVSFSSEKSATKPEKGGSKTVIINTQNNINI